MPRLRIPADTYSKARIIARREGLDFKAWARSKARKYNGGAISCVCTRSDSVVVQIDVDLPCAVIRSAIISASNAAVVASGAWSEETIRNQIFIESFWGRTCTREQAIELLNNRQKEVCLLIDRKTKRHTQRNA